MKKTYRTARGKSVDLGALQLKNENVRAVGNMPVNARGDIIDSNNKTVKKRNQVVSQHYKKQTNVVDEPVMESRAKAQEAQANVAPAPVKEVAKPAAKAAVVEEPAVVEESTVVEEPAVVEEPSGGLAAAIAKSKKVTQSKMTPSSTKDKNKNLRI